MTSDVFDSVTTKSDAFDSVATKKAKETSTIIINDWSTVFVVIRNYEMEARKADSGNWENVKF